MITIPFLPNYTIALSTRTEGSVTTPEKVQALLTGFNHKKTVGYLKLQHGSFRVHWKDQIEPNEADAVLTHNTDLALSMVVGDCIPIILIDRKHHVLAMIHGGWRSLLQNIVQLTMKEMKGHYSTAPEDVYVWIGPGIRQESNTSLQPPVQSMFSEWQEFITFDGKLYHVDLIEYIKSSLIQCNVQPENIFDYGKDTYQEKETFFSHRRAVLENDEDGRFLVAVWKN